jgi:hypothetical protein
MRNLVGRVNDTRVEKKNYGEERERTECPLSFLYTGTEIELSGESLPLDFSISATLPCELEREIMRN